MKRRNALLLCAGFILVLFVSSAFLIHEADHDCCGEDCPICRTIAMTTSLMRVLSIIITAWLLYAGAETLSSARQGSESLYGCVPDTPVSLKIRMND